MEFKVGDKVKRTESSFDEVRLGHNYIVDKIVGTNIKLKGYYNIYEKDFFVLVNNNDLEELINTANQGLEALCSLVKDHRNNPHLMYAHPQGLEVTMKNAFPVGMDSPAKVFLKTPNFVYNSAEMTLEDAKKLNKELQEYLKKVEG